MGLLVLSALSAQARWVKAVTPHFEVYTAASRGETREIVGDLELFHRVVSQLFGGRQWVEEQTRLVMFDRHRDFAAVVPDRATELSKIGAIVNAQEDSSFMAMSGESHWKYSKILVQGIYTHTVLQRLGLHEQAWFARGASVMFSMFEVGREEVVLGRAPLELVDRLNKMDRLLPLETLFSATQQEWGDYGFHQRRMMDAHAWLLMHYAFFSAERSREWRAAILGLVYEVQFGNTDWNALVQAHLGVDLETLQAELTAYARHRRYATVVLPHPEGWTGRELDYDRVDPVEMADVMLETRIRLARDQTAITEILERLETEPRVRLYELAGLHALYNRQPQLAFARWRKAIEAGSEDPYVVRAEAQFTVVDRVHRGLLDLQFSAEEATTLRAALERSLELNPSDQYALQWLAWLEALAEEPSVAHMNRVQRAVRDMVRPELTLLAIAVFRLRAGDLETARAIIEPYQLNTRRNWQWKQAVLSIERKLAATSPAEG